MRDQGICRVRNHHKRQLSPQPAVGKQILYPELFHRLLDHWQFVMAIKLAFSQAREVLTASHHSCCPQTGKKLAGVCSRLPRIRRNRPRTHHAARRLKRQVQCGREVDIESQRPAVLSNHLPMLTE